ncbi:alpha/beta hydrolase [Aspergillus ibericus CBS 121593]|uniref:Alpha/beta-hydrolase n=1 Tax=Aspergillus ibericus CBS 121593 TaxID=1448316 RepID=A0A395GND9_9EURO|nr:alpha/beta-hydrolase [Aspergillus ibericus CBS 121593]RAK96478.1 alpha/beta-hydrolase [Aspergillus ibericus CBS 121593]
MTTPNNLAVVICHGSYQTPAPYEPLIQSLQAHGIDAYCPQRPTCDLNRLNVGDVNHPDFDREPPAGGYPSDTEDVDVVIQLVEKLVNQDGKLVLLAAQSSGGWVATQAAAHALQAKPRQAVGKAGGIIGLFYMGAFVIPVGESVTSFFQPKDGSFHTPPFMRFHKHGHTGLGTAVDAPRYMFNDIDPEEAEKWAATLTASPIMTDRLTNDAYSVLPCAYLVLENDLCLAKEYQEGMIALQTQRGAGFTVYYAPSGHSPHLSWTGGVVEKIEEFVGKILKE